MSAAILEVGIAFRASVESAVKALKKFEQIFAELGEQERRERALEEYVEGKVWKAFNPRVDVRLVTTSEGRCRVIVRELGGWA